MPGELGELVQSTESEKADIGSSARKRTRKSTGVPATPGPGGVRTAGTPVAVLQQQQQQQQQQTPLPAHQMTQMAQMGLSTPHQQHQAAHQSIMSAMVSQNALAGYQALQRQVLATSGNQSALQPMQRGFPTERSIAAAAGGPAILANSFTQKLPAETGMLAYLSVHKPER